MCADGHVIYGSFPGGGGGLWPNSLPLPPVLVTTEPQFSKAIILDRSANTETVKQRDVGVVKDEERGFCVWFFFGQCQ